MTPLKAHLPCILEFHTWQALAAIFIRAVRCECFDTHSMVKDAMQLACMTAACAVLRMTAAFTIAC